MRKTNIIIITTLSISLLLTACNSQPEIQNTGESVGNSYRLNLDEVRPKGNKEEAMKKLKKEFVEKFQEKNFKDIKEEDELKEQNKTLPSAIKRITEEPTDLSKQMATEYLDAITKASNNSGTPKWVLIGVSTLEGNGLYTKNPPVPGSAIPSRLYGQEGLTFKNYGKKQIDQGLGDRTAGVSDGAGVKGPFKMKEEGWQSWGADANGDGVKDIYNLYDAAEGAGNMLNHQYKFIDGRYPNLSEDAKWIWTMGAYNAGRGGMLARVPMDSLENFIAEDLQGIVNDRNLQQLVYSNYMNIGRGWQMRQPIIEYWDEQGWLLDEQLRTKAINNSKAELEQKMGTPNINGRWPGDLKGNRSNQGYKTSKSYKEVAHKGNNEKDRVAMNIETMEYLVASYSVGKSMEQELTYKVNEIKDKVEIKFSLKPDEFAGPTTVRYFWEQQDAYKDLPAKDKKLMSGKLGETGWKGSFPIFIQEEGFPNGSKTPWKFTGRNTTLGRSGCSIYSATALLHGAGFGDENIPNTEMKPTLENLTKVLPNGPIIGTHMRELGYKIKMMPTGTDKDLDALFSDLQAGIPYIVNTRSGEVKGIDRKGNSVTTQFTSGGHFLTMVSGYKVKNKRYVEVVQSSRSNASTKGEDKDQNRISFDFDHLVKKKILRSSGGTAVPAYTIVGIQDKQIKPTYLTKDYVAPTPKENTQIEKPTTTQIIRREQLIEMSEDSKTLTYLLKHRENEYKMKPNIDIELKETSFVEYKNNNVIIYLDYINGVMITDLKDTLWHEGTIKSGTNLGTTTENSEFARIVRDDATGEWFNLETLLSDID